MAEQDVEKRAEEQERENREALRRADRTIQQITQTVRRSERIWRESARPAAGR